MSKNAARPERRWGAKTVLERKEDRRARIMTTAVELYGRDGFRNVSVKSICVTAGLSERYLYESFENNEDLLRQCFSKLNGELISQLRKVAFASSGKILQRLRASVRSYLEHLERNPAAARLFLIEMVNVSPKAEALFLQSLDDFGVLIIEIVSTDKNQNMTVNPLLLRGITGGGFHIARAWISGGYSEDIEQVIDAFIQLYTPLLGRTGAR